MDRGHANSFWIYGRDDGSWQRTGKALLGFNRDYGFDWQMAPAMSGKNGWRNFSVDCTNIYNPGFVRALEEIVRDYPELLEWIIAFDGPFERLDEVLVAGRTLNFSWTTSTFLHGTSELAWQLIQQSGLCPRAMTGATPKYGAAIDQTKASQPDRVYLTVHLGTASFASRDAARGTNSRRVILLVDGVPDPQLLLPDEDSRESTPFASLGRTGSFAYRGCIPADRVQLGYAADAQGHFQR